MRKLALLAVALIAVSLLAVGSAAAATDAKRPPLPCAKYVPSYGAYASTRPPTWKCAQTIYGWWLDCVLKAQESDTLTGASCFKLRATTTEVIANATGVSRRTKRNELIDYEGLLEGFCTTYDSFYCSIAADVEREIRKLS